MVGIDLSEFYRYSRPKKRPCQVAFAAESLDDADREKLDAACGADQGIITNSAIQQWLSVRGHEMSVAAVISHRRGTCTCGR